MEVGIENRKGGRNNKLLLGGGALLLILSLILLYSWLNLFFTVATSRGGNICWGTSCDEAEWQAALSHTLNRSIDSSSLTLKPFLLIFHISLIVFIIRSWQKGSQVCLPLEFGILNIFWIFAGTVVFMLIYLSYKAATPPPQYPIIVPLATVEGASASTPAPGTETSIDGPYLVITGPPAPPSGGCVIADQSGWSIFDPNDGRCFIGNNIPYWVYGKQLAWSGLLASIFLTLGLSISQVSGWLGRRIGRMSPTYRLGIMFIVFGLVTVCVLAELRIFGVYLLW